MKKLFFLLLVLSGTVCHAQTQFFMVDATASASTPVYVKINLTNEFQCGSGADNPSWNYVCGNATTISTTNGVSYSNLIASDGTTTSLGITNLSGWSNYQNAPSQGSNAGIFPDMIEGTAWIFADGAQLQISGLTVGAQYKFYFYSNTESWRYSVVQFSVGGGTSGQINNSQNIGSNTTYPNWEDDPALVSVSFTASGTTTTITCNIISGYTPATLNAIVIKKL